jgi:hypothetical protein
MRSARGLGFLSALAWFFFPLVPALLGTTCYSVLNPGTTKLHGPDPRDWTWPLWLLLTGPLIGYGFLAGATIDLPDDPEQQGWQAFFSKCSLWVAVGPWAGFLAWEALKKVGWAPWDSPPGTDWSMRWIVWGLYLVFFFCPIAYGWLPIACVALLRARRLGRFGQSLARGLGVAVGFVGSLFGSFWAITEAWRGYFFDPRIIPALLAASTLALMAGCTSPETLGEVRRRDLFQSMLLAWLLGLALAWRWWSRSRSKSK